MSKVHLPKTRNRSESRLAQIDFKEKPPTKISFFDVATSAVLEGLSMEERHRQELIYDLLNIEKQYVYELQMMTEVFWIQFKNSIFFKTRIECNIYELDRYCSCEQRFN